MKDKPLYGLILSGGESRRMGQDKALLNHNGKTQLSYIADLVSESVEKTFVSIRANQSQDSERSLFNKVIDNYENIGPIAGILTALEMHPKMNWLVVACDLPNITRKTIKHLIDNQGNNQSFTSYMSSYENLPEPLCAIYHSGSVKIIKEFVSNNVNCPRKILIRSKTKLIEQLEPHSLDNINTPDELQKSILSFSN